MKKNTIGQTNVEVTEISFGCASIGNLYREITDKQSQHVLTTAWEAGIRYYDTAPHYGRGRSEVRLGQFLQNKIRSDFILSTKVGRVLSSGEAVAQADCYINPLPNDVRYDYSGDGIEQSLERLQQKQVDILYVHDIGTFAHGKHNAKHLTAFLASGYEKLIKLKECGRIRAFGLGVNENEICLTLMKHCQFDVILLAGRLTILDRSAEIALVDCCRQTKTSIVVGGVFNSGILATGVTDNPMYNYAPAPKEIKHKVNQLQATAETLHMSLASAALHFCKNHAATASLLLGTAKSQTLIQNMQLLNQSVPRNFNQAFAIS